MLRMYTDPKGEAYKQVIDLAIQNSECFVLGYKMVDLPSENQKYQSVLEELKPYLMKTIVIQNNNREEVIQIREAYRSHAFYCSGTYYFYKSCEESGLLLKQFAGSLSDWIFPNLPEDLCFLKKDGEDYLYSVVHEGMYGINVSENEAIELMDQITGLFIEIEAHRDFNRLLDDAIKQKTDRLYISGHRLKKLPDRICELTELRWLEIFEQDLYRLPQALFELSKLESLRIMTADLESIPGSIAKLKNLKELQISCASSDRPDSTWRTKSKEEISLNCIPTEIGELEQLEQLTINYTSIHELPIELEKLKRLRSLNIENCMIDQKPAFLQRMKQLEYVNVSRNSIFESLALNEYEMD
ncbi:leucine-rich repeat domain-containing protein [Paenibacillus sp. Marseille-Q7038]